MLYKSSSNSLSVQVLPQKLGMGWGSNACTGNADKGGGVQNKGRWVIHHHHHDPITNHYSNLAFIIRERSSITSARLGGVGGLSQNADTADALEGGGGV